MACACAAKLSLPRCHLIQFKEFLSNITIHIHREVTLAEKDLAERVIVQGETIQTVVVHEDAEEEAAEISRLNEEASRTRIDPTKRKEAALREQQALFEAERLEAERIAALLGQPADSAPIESESSAPSPAELEKKAKAEKAANEKVQKAEMAKKAAEEKAAAKLAAEAEAAAKKQAKAEAEAKAKAEAQAKKQEAAEAAKLAKTAKATASAAAPAPVSPQPAEPTPKTAATAVPQREIVGAQFKDARSGLSISTALSDAEQVITVESIAPIQVEPKRTFATEESIFGSSTAHEPLDFSKLPPAGNKPSLGFLDDDDDSIFTRATSSIAKKQTAKSTTAPSKSVLSFDDDDDILFRPTTAKKASAPKSTSDDLFAMLDGPTTSKPATTKKSGIDSNQFDIDSFISSTKSSGGLFDD